MQTAMVDVQPSRFVIPVRYVAGGKIVQTTSTALGTEAIHVRSARPPAAGRVVGLQLDFPGLGEKVAPLSIVAETTFGPEMGFWAEFAGNDSAKQRIAALLARQRRLTDQNCHRFHTGMSALVRQRGQADEAGQVTNISQTGAFLRLEALPPKGSVVELDVGFPDDPVAETALAFVVHVAPRRGIGVQFIGAGDEFRTRLDRHLAEMAR